MTCSLLPRVQSLRGETMKPFVPMLCAAVLVMSTAAPGFAGAGSAPQPAPLGAVAQGSVLDHLVEVRSGKRHYQHRRGFDRRGVHRRGHYAPPSRVQRHRPSRSQRSGPDLGAAVVGAIIGGIIVHQLHQRPQPRGHSGAFLSQAHIDWCFNRWRSYRLSDNSYQPYHGPRRVCVSPYGPS